MSILTMSGSGAASTAVSPRLYAIGWLCAIQTHMLTLHTSQTSASTLDLGFSSATQQGTLLMQLGGICVCMERALAIQGSDVSPGGQQASHCYSLRCEHWSTQLHHVDMCANVC